MSSKKDIPSQISHLVTQASIKEREAFDEFKHIQNIVDERMQFLSKKQEMLSQKKEELERAKSTGRKRVFSSGMSGGVRDWKKNIDTLIKNIEKLELQVKEAEVEALRAERFLDDKRSQLQLMQRKKSKYQSMVDQRNIEITQRSSFAEDEQSQESLRKYDNRFGKWKN